ncbi:MAG: type I restriction enzyme HsdR N-terminal domain-containing protein [Phaeodactylibacter sp.]|nr:type I restriction enzyme HsdR N-terminal domain-containing protein [Phaeodactylibacter sp.]
MLDLDLLQFQDQLDIRRENGKTYVLDVIRKKYLALAPEELVRQLLIQHLIKVAGYSKNRLSIEKGLKVNGLPRRWDLLIYAPDMSPFMLVECKAPSVKLNQDVFEQIAWYNMSIRVPYLLVTNGLQSLCYELDYENAQVLPCKALPLYPA